MERWRRGTVEGGVNRDGPLFSASFIKFNGFNSISRWHEIRTDTGSDDHVMNNVQEAR
jgi:hypothetical protein